MANDDKSPEEPHPLSPKAVDYVSRLMGDYQKTWKDIRERLRALIPGWAYGFCGPMADEDNARFAAAINRRGDEILALIRAGGDFRPVIDALACAAVAFTVAEDRLKHIESLSPEEWYLEMQRALPEARTYREPRPEK